MNNSTVWVLQYTHHREARVFSAIDVAKLWVELHDPGHTWTESNAHGEVWYYGLRVDQNNPNIHFYIASICEAPLISQIKHVQKA